MAKSTSGHALLEQLERRTLLSAGVSGSGILSITGTSGDDVITIERNADNRRKIDVTVNGETETFRAARIRHVVASGGDGEDLIALGQGVKISATMFGGKGDDVLMGGRRRDQLLGEEGDDDLHGGRGKDAMFGGEGQDVFQSSDSLREMRDRDEDDGIRIQLGEAPAAVQAAVLDLLEGNEFENLLRETDEGATVFELEWEAGGVPHSAKIDLAGAVIELEVEIDIADLPSAVTSAVFARYPEGEITEAETLQLPGLPQRFEVEVENAGLVRELVITPEGEILSDEVEGEVE